MAVERGKFNALAAAIRDSNIPILLLTGESDPMLLEVAEQVGVKNVLQKPITSQDLGAQNAVMGGGRYDGLIEELGGPAMPGFGFAIGMERLISLIPRDQGRAEEVDLALVSLGEEAWEATRDMAARLRAKGVGCIVPLVERPMRAQLRRADKAGARFALFVGKEELSAGSYGLKDLSTGEQVTVEETAIPAHVKEQRI